MARTKKDGPSAPLWFVSFADLVTNMLCFFVMLFAFASLDAGAQDSSKAASSKEKSRSQAKAMESLFAVNFTTSKDQSASLRPIIGGKSILFAPQPKNLEEIPRIAKKVKQRLQDAKIKEKVEVTIDDRNVKVRIPSKVLFLSGQAILRPGSDEVLTALTPILTELNYDIRVDGHSDERPARSNVYPSNWELSTARACTVVRFYTEHLGINPERFSAQGYSSYRPQVENITEKDRETNRRVEIIILTSKRPKPDVFRWE